MRQGYRYWAKVALVVLGLAGYACLGVMVLFEVAHPVTRWIFVLSALGYYFTVAAAHLRDEHR